MRRNIAAAEPQKYHWVIFNPLSDPRYFLARFSPIIWADNVGMRDEVGYVEPSRMDLLFPIAREAARG